MNTQPSLITTFDPITLWFADGALHIAIDAPLAHDQALRFSRIVRRNPGVKAVKVASTNNKWSVTFSRVDNLGATQQSIRTQAEQFLKFEQTRPPQLSMFDNAPTGHYSNNLGWVSVPAE